MLFSAFNERRTKHKGWLTDWRCHVLVILIIAHTEFQVNIQMKNKVCMERHNAVELDLLREYLN